MSKNLFSLFSFGLLLLVIGSVGTFLHWEQSMVFMGLGLALESLALLVFAWNKIRNR